MNLEVINEACKYVENDYYRGDSLKSNCWGLTAAIFNWVPHIQVIYEDEIKHFLDTYTEEIKEEDLQPGDIISLWGAWRHENSDIQHTAVYVGDGKWLHQRGYHEEVAIEGGGDIFYPYQNNRVISGAYSLFHRIKVSPS